MTFNTTINKEHSIKNKEELQDMLKKYKGILNNSIIDYLNSLIELDFSIIKENISEEERILLSELAIYKEIANYNINQRAISIIETKKNKIETAIKSDEEQTCIYGNIDGNSIILFSFDYIGSEKHEDKIGKVTLYQTINNINQIEKEINRINNILESLEKERNPYTHINNIYGGPSSNWTIRHNNKIVRYEDKLNKLYEKNTLTDNDKLEIEITNMIHELLLEDYGLTNDSFVEDQVYKRNLSEQTELYKSYVKYLPKVKVKNNIKYI